MTSTRSVSRAVASADMSADGRRPSYSVHWMGICTRTSGRPGASAVASAGGQVSVRSCGRRVAGKVGGGGGDSEVGDGEADFDLQSWLVAGRRGCCDGVSGVCGVCGVWGRDGILRVSIGLSGTGGRTGKMRFGRESACSAGWRLSQENSA